MAGRVQRVTIIGLTIVVAGHVVLNLVWGSPAWHQLVYDVFGKFRWNS